MPFSTTQFRDALLPAQPLMYDAHLSLSLGRSKVRKLLTGSRSYVEWVNVGGSQSPYKASTQRNVKQDGS